MIIGINGNEANVQHRVGINQWSFELLKQFSQNRELKSNIRVYLKELPRQDMPDLDYKVLPGPGMWTLTTLQKEMIFHPPDILFSMTHYAPLILRCPSVISIMDLSFEKFPQYFKKSDLFQLRYWTRLSAMQASHIITISEFTKNDIIKIYGIDPEKITVAYPGYDSLRFNTKVVPSKKYGDYILYLGTLQPRKNLERLIQAFYQLLTNNYKLVIVGMINEGRGGWMNENLKVKSQKAKGKIILTGYLPDEEIPGLMAGAKAFVLPSLYEGFGIPAIEAMAVGTPVIVSRVSSLPEICGEAATYIEDPYSVESIKTALGRGLKNNNRKLGLEWVKRYNWETAADQTIAVLEDVCRQKWK
jgi:glycosyltransferase involved in cell wall biosynthesis